MPSSVTSVPVGFTNSFCTAAINDKSNAVGETVKRFLKIPPTANSVKRSGER